jgi:bifunctional non-homologous end joining protein LigD
MDSIKPMLATAVSDLGKLHYDKMWALEPKMDGIRVLVSADPVTRCVSYQTRNGHPLPSLALLSPVVLKLADAVGKAVTFDCEATAGDDFFSGVGHLTQKAEATDLARLTVFDVPWVDGWGASSEVPYSLRRECLETMFSKAELTGDDDQKVALIQVVDIITTSTLVDMADSLLADALDAGWEGLMVKDVDAPYLSGRRSRAWIKLKGKQTYDCRVVGFQPGKGRLDGSAGALLVCYQGKTIAVAGGLTDAQRQDIYDHPENWVGKIAEVECQQLTPSGSMRHPSIICIRWDK